MIHRLLYSPGETGAPVQTAPRCYRGPADLPDCVVEVECPSWCAEDHAVPVAPGVPRFLDDDFHVSAPITVVPPPEVHGSDVSLLPQLTARLMAHTIEGGVMLGAASIHMELGTSVDAYADLDVAGADDVLRQLREYVVGLQQMRDALAAVQKVAS
ncbi:DUF6907 domain-containing protein [Streptomyces sp. NPDC048462]|uniref:DUF6907 domain-containing protein n=1 Tax=Streptomyces sp. NPDC048462 TaxID=3365555 RepID=UPI00372417BC